MRGAPFPSPEDLPDPGTEPSFLRLLHWQADTLSLAPLGSSQPYGNKFKILDHIKSNHEDSPEDSLSS